MNKERLSLKLLKELTKKETEDFKAVLACEFLFNDENCFLYQERDVFLYPDWLRKPISACYVCMSSVFGSIIWWTFIYLQEGIFNWSKHPHKCYFLFWITFLVILSMINRIIGKKSYYYV